MTGVRDLPVDPVLGDPVGVVAVGRRGVDELGDDVLDELGVAERERLPVLEDVAPVALEVEDPVALGVAHLDVEAVPGAAGVAVPPAEGEGQVLVGVPLQVRVPQGGRAGDQRRAVLDRGEAVQEGPVALPGDLVRPADEAGEVGSGDVVAVEVDAAAQVVEEDVPDVVGRGEPVGGELHPVGRRHDPREISPAREDVLPHLGDQPGRPSKAGAELDHLPLGSVHVGHHRPLPRPARRERAGRLEQVGAAPSPRLGCGPGGAPGVEGGEPVGGEVHPGPAEPVAPHGAGLQGLARLGAIDRLGGQRVERQRGPGDELAPLVGVEQAAELQLEVLVHVGREDVQEPVEDLDPGRVPAPVLDGALPDEAEPVARGPLVAEGDAEIAVRLLEHEPVADHVLVEAPGDGVGEQVGLAEGVPEGGAPAPRHPQGGDRPGDPRRVDELVLGDVREEGEAGVPAAGGEPAVAGHEEPVVGIADHAHEEGAHPLGLVDDVERVAGDLGKASRGGKGFAGNGAPAEEDACWSPHVAPAGACPPHRFGRNFVRQQNKLCGGPVGCQDGDQAARCGGPRRKTCRFPARIA